MAMVGLVALVSVALVTWAARQRSRVRLRVKLYVHLDCYFRGKKIGSRNQPRPYSIWGILSPALY